MEHGLQIGWQIDEETGNCIKKDETYMCTLLFTHVFPESVLSIGMDTKTTSTYQYWYAYYSVERPLKYIYTYAYQEEQQWATYQKAFSAKEWSFANYTFHKEGYVRMTFRRADGKTLSEQDRENVARAICFKHPLEVRHTNYIEQKDVKEEIKKTVQTVMEKRNEHSLVMTLLSDTHYTVNGNWEDTAATIEAVNGQIHPDGIIHLGDLTDGILSKEICRYYNSKVLDRIKSWQIPFYMVIGNHDTNYFRNNPELLSKEEQYHYYLKGIVSGNLEEGQLWYYQDFAEYKLRFLFLHSFDAQQDQRYGFPEEEVDWLLKMLEHMPEGYLAVLFSHEAPLAKLDYWAKEVRNGELLIKVLEEWHRNHGERILAFVHGHTHADYIYRGKAFPIISIGCSKCEYFADKKPEGAYTCRRELGTVLQELWDTMIITPKERKIEFVRFGSGLDRQVLPEKEKKKPQVQIWAHRGASGYAPENTLEAFQLAYEMGADGIELDVQLTSDRQIVVLHDETVNRTSDGTGYVADLTLKRLKELHFNKMHPEYEKAAIPTLQEVLALVKPTPMIVNIELKTGVNFYEGIEEAVLKLVQDMGMEDRVIYSSFNHYSIIRIKRLKPDAKCAFLYCDGIHKVAEYAKTYGIEALHPSLNNMQYLQLIEQCKDMNIKIHVWTVNEEKDIQQMLDIGVDAIITNYPDRAYEVIHKKMLREYAKEKHQPVEHRNKNKLLHGLGVSYSKIRKVFVKIDQMVQKLAGKYTGG